MRFKVIFCIVYALVLTLTSCDSTSSDPVGISILYGLTTEPSGIDPHRHEETAVGIVSRQIYDTLVYRHPDTGEFVPGLAASWTISDDNLVYTFTLKDNVLFHDGTLLEASAVAVNLDRIISLGSLSQKARILLGPYQGHQIVDQLTIQLLLAQPYAPFLDALSQPYLGIASPLALSLYSENRYQYHQVGTGPFRMVSYTPGGDIILRRSDVYTWGPEFYQPVNADSVTGVTFRFLPNPPERVQALNEFQVVTDIRPSDARELTGNSQINLINVEIPGQSYQFLMNVNAFPTDNLSFRQALLFGTNRQVITDSVYQGFSQPAWGVLAQTTLFYSPEVVGRYAFNQTQARALLNSIGFVDSDGNGYFDTTQGDLTVRILAPSGNQISAVSQLLTDQLQAIGIRIEIDQAPGETLLRERWVNETYNLVAFFDDGLDPVFLNNYFLTGASNGFTNFSNTQLDQALLVSVAESNSAFRRELYTRIQRFILDQALILPINDQTTINAAVSGIQNLAYDSSGWYPILNNVIYIRG